MIEQTPVPDLSDSQRGVVAGGAVGSRWAGRFRLFRYEIRLWLGGHIPDVAEAVESPRRLAQRRRSGGPFLLTAQGFERQMATNHLGHAALVTALWPLLHASAVRVVLVSSTEARGGQLSPQTTREQLLNPAPYDGRQVYRTWARPRR